MTAMSNDNPSDTLDFVAALRNKQTAPLHDWIKRLGGSTHFAEFVQDAAKKCFSRILPGGDAGNESETKASTQFNVQASQDGSDAMTLHVRVGVPGPDGEIEVVPYVHISWVRHMNMVLAAMSADRHPTIINSAESAENYYLSQTRWLRERINVESNGSTIIHSPFRFALAALGELLNRVSEIYSIDSPCGHRDYFGIYQIDVDSPIEVVSINFCARGMQANLEENLKGNGNEQ
jgi:hypothetical protein